jgi:hypothetical protein
MCAVGFQNVLLCYLVEKSATKLLLDPMKLQNLKIQCLKNQLVQNSKNHQKT